LLSIVRANQPDRQRIKGAIAQEFFSNSPDPNISENTIFALSEYQLLDKPTDDISHAKLTELGESLAEMADAGNLTGMYERFAQHILVNLHGLELIQCIEDLAQRGSKITKQTIAKELKYRGHHIPSNGTHLNDNG
jgi:site-specific DNA-methyltransferase (cytosine-N4-specific)